MKLLRQSDSIAKFGIRSRPSLLYKDSGVDSRHLAQSAVILKLNLNLKFFVTSRWMLSLLVSHIDYAVYC